MFCVVSRLKRAAASEAEGQAVRVEDELASRPAVRRNDTFVVDRAFVYTDERGKQQAAGEGSTIVPLADVAEGSAPDTPVSVVITKKGGSVSKSGVILLGELQDKIGSGEVKRRALTEEEAQAVEADKGDLNVERSSPEAETEAVAVEGTEVAGDTSVENADNEALNANGGGAGAGVETQEIENNEVAPAQTLADEQEFDENGRQFVKSKDGTTVFGEVGEDSGLTAAPIRLSVGVDTVDEDGIHHGYGLAHIEAGHGEQIRNAGYSTIEDFVEEVARNYTDIREGSRIAGTQTYLLEVSDKHNNTLFVQLSKNGKYWNVNSAGIFRKKYSRHKPKVSTVPAVGLDTNADIEGVNHGQSDGATVTSGDSPETFQDKGTQVSEENKVQLPENPVALKWAALVEANEGDEAEALDTAVQMVGNKTAELEQARKTVTKGKTEEAIQEAKRAKREKVSALETELQFWKDVAGYPEKKRASEAQAAELNARLERERKRKEQQASNPNYGLRQTEADDRLGAPLSLREYVVRKIATGRVKFLWSGSESGTGGLKEHGGAAKRQMLYTDKTRGQYPEDVAEAMRLDIADNYPEFGQVEASDILSEIENLSVGEQTPSEMMEEAERLHERSARFVTDTREVEDVSAEVAGMAPAAVTPPVDTEEQEGKPRFAGEVFADEEWMRGGEADEAVPFQRVSVADVSPLATERQAKSIANQLKKLGLKGEVRIVDGVSELVKEARARLQSVFHGSPHGFKTFDFSHMGSGEGLQAYGWGGYVTEVEGIGRTYAEALAEKDDKLRENKIINDLVRELLERNSKEDALSYLQSLLNESWSDKKRVKAQIKILETGRFLKEPVRHLYHVEIPTEQDGNYLRWDDDMDDATRDKILSGVTQIADVPVDADYFAEKLAQYEDEYNIDGKALYKLLSEYAFRSDKAASEFLSSLGFVGISYPAQYRSGGRADNARNYVIFKESDMKITDHIRYEQDASGEIAGATLPNGDVLLNRQAMRIDTPFHEFAHKLFTYANGNRSAGRLYEAIRRYAREAPQAVKDYVAARYPDLKDDAYLDEVFAWALSRQSEGGLEAFLKERGIGVDDTASRTWYERVWEAVKALWAEVRPKVSRLLGRDFADLSVFDAYDEMGAEETGKALYDLMMGGKRLPGEEKAAEGTEARAQMGSAEEAEIERRAKADGTWLKAPNGKPTKLTPGQWVQVRTKAFKDWFVDWELAAAFQNIKKIIPTSLDGLQPINQKEAEDIVSKMPEGENRLDGRKVLWVKSSVGKILRHRGFDTSLLMPKLKEVYDNSVHIISEQEEKKDGHKEHTNFNGYHHYVGKVELDGTEYYVRFTLQEINTRNKNITPNQLHSAFVSDVEITSANPRVNTGNTPATAKVGTYMDAKLQNFLKEASLAEENSSKVVDENGEPLVVYHGTLQKGLTEFNKDFIGSRYSYDDKGFFFISSENIAKDYSVSEFDSERRGEVIPAFISLKSPLVVNSKWARENGLGGQVFKDNDVIEFWDNYQSLMLEESENSDGVVIDDGKYQMVVAFSPTQIKSATDNVGTFDAGNPDIRYRFAGDMFAEDGRTKNDDAAYLAAVERGDTETAQRMVNEAAARAGYNASSDYQGSLAFNGAAPSKNGYFDTKEERKAAWENGEYEGEMSLGDFMDSDIDTHDLGWHLTDSGAKRIESEYTQESIDNLSSTVKSGKRTIKMYRAVDASVKENSFRNGDWVTPSRKYAQYHIGLQDWKEGRIIEQEVSVDDIWWDGDDINEWGYDDGKDYGYGNTENNRKLLDAVTRDDAGDIIPLSRRFDQKKSDARYRFIGEKGAAAKTSLEAKRQAALDAGASLGVPIVEEEAPAGGRRRAKDEALGWFDTRTGAVHVNPGNHADAEDVKRTVMHEAVGHMGMRRLLDGKHPGAYDAFLDRVHAAMPAEAQAYFLDYARRSQAGRPLTEAELNRIAADEYVAALAEVGGDANVWQRVVAEVRELLRRIGFDIDLSEADIRALLYESKHNLESAAYYAEREMMRREQKEYRDEANLSNRLDEDADVLYRMRRAGTSRDGRLGVISIDADSNGRYGAWTRQGLFKRASDVARYFLDDSLPLRHMMTHIKRSVGGVVTDATDLWRQKTMVVSRSRYRIDEYNRKIGEPLMKTVRGIYRATKDMAADYFGDLSKGGKAQSALAFFYIRHCLSL